MNKNELVACMIMEAVSDPVKPMNLQVNETNGLFYLNFDTCLQSFNVFNRNKRRYIASAMVPSLNADHIIELISKKSWYGEAGHPDDDNPRRILTIDPKLISHRINTKEIRGNKLYGNIDTLDNNSHGNEMTKCILQGMEPAFSLRALAPLTKHSDGSSTVNNKCHIVTYDWVILPSHKDAYRDQSKPVQKITESISSSGNNFIGGSQLIGVTEASIKDYISMESINVNWVSNVFDVMKESMVLNESMNSVVLKEGSETFVVKLEDRIKQEVRRYMTKM